MKEISWIKKLLEAIIKNVIFPLKINYFFFFFEEIFFKFYYDEILAIREKNKIK